MVDTIVIGGTRGTGLAVSEYFVSKRHRVLVTGRKEPSDTFPGMSYRQMDLTELTQAGVEQIAWNLDWSSVKNIIFCQRFRAQAADWAGEMQVSVNSTRALMCYFGMKLTSRASVVLVSSNASRFVVPEQDDAYHIAKASVNALIRYYAVNLGPKGIRVNGIEPCTLFKSDGFLAQSANSAAKDALTELNPIRQMVTPQDVASIAYFLCSEQSKAINGQVIVADGGVSLLGQEGIVRRAQ